MITQERKAVYVAAAVRWLASHDRRIEFSLTELYEVYRHLAPKPYLMTGREMKSIAWRNAIWLGIERTKKRGAIDQTFRIRETLLDTYGLLDPNGLP